MKPKAYSSWRNMKRRCLDIKWIFYKNYGGRGIKVCDEWLIFENFYKDMGECPQNKSLDRIDNNGNYCKENCRWATRTEQCRNKTKNVFVTYKGRKMTLVEVSKKTGLSQKMISKRLKRGWPEKDAISVKPLKNGPGGKSYTDRNHKVTQV